MSNRAVRVLLLCPVLALVLLGGLGVACAESGTDVSPSTAGTAGESGPEQQQSGLEDLSLLVTLYYSAALLVGLAVAFLGWRSIRDMRSRAGEVASEVFTSHMKETEMAIKNLRELLAAVAQERRLVAEEAKSTRGLLAAKASMEDMAEGVADMGAVIARASLLPDEEKLFLLSAVVSHRMKGTPPDFHNAGTEAEFVPGGLRLALQIFKLGLEDHPENVTLLADAGETAGRLGQYQEAEDLFKKATEVAPDEPRVWEFLADHWFRFKEDPQKAIEILEPKLDTLRPSPGLMREARADLPSNWAA